MLSMRTPQTKQPACLRMAALLRNAQIIQTFSACRLRILIKVRVITSVAAGVERARQVPILPAVHGLQNQTQRCALDNERGAEAAEDSRCEYGRGHQEIH